MKSIVFLYLSLIAILIGITSWVVAIPNSYNSLGTIWMLTWIINPLGAIFGLLSLKTKNALSKLAIILNIILTFSFGLMWSFGDLFGFQLYYTVWVYSSVPLISAISPF
ncbi:hypothetical protein [Peribacillus sp. Hz7]|uniref:hypothetical protein n=1 Tax=Peribacillus sp. Hz7 TaxID=3344873 RepID=UPI0035C9AFB5